MENENTYLVIEDRSGSKSYSIGNFFTIGRSGENSFCIDDPNIQPRHSRIEKTDKGFVIQDMRTQTGTFVNGTRIMEAYLKPMDQIRLGPVIMTFSPKTEKINKERLLPKSKNPNWKKLLEKVPNYAQSEYPILILGESGSGKDVLAHTVHDHSTKSTGPLISINCSALSETLIESELFGHSKGSFTGAISDRKGAFELARGGTLFLDEIGDLPLILQPKLLRALENKEIWPIGSDKCIKTDVRIISATNHSLPQKIHNGNFRADLFYRLNLISIKVPALCERMEDFEDILFGLAKEMRVRFSYQAIQKIKTYSWPGNIRELKNMVTRAHVEFGNRQIEPEHIEQLMITLPNSENEARIDTRSAPQTNSKKVSLIKELEREMIVQRLIVNEGNQRRTANELGMPKSTLHDRLRCYGIDVDKFKRKFF